MKTDERLPEDVPDKENSKDPPADNSFGKGEKDFSNENEPHAGGGVAH